MNRIIEAAIAASVLSLSLPAFATVTTCAPDSANHAIAETYNANWLAALNSADAGRISELYAESAVLMPPSDETIVGRQPISEYLSSNAGPASHARYSVDLVSCEVHGNALHIAGVWGAAVPGADSPTLATGNLLRVLEADGEGHWTSSYEIWN